MSSIENLTKQYQILTDWFLSVLEGIDDKDGARTISENTNSLEWLAGHLITGRYRNMSRLGIQLDTYLHIDKFVNKTIPPPNAIPFSKTIEYPALSDSIEQWNKYSKLFLETLRNCDDEILKTVTPLSLLTGNTVEDVLTFIVLHETYHIGQMSIIRKTLGYSEMKLGMTKVEPGK
jgi:uncharacterized damage-inducible protein DinB